MASYRYERDIKEEDLRPRAQLQYTRRERWNNWWDYNLKWVVVAAIAVGFVGYCFIGQYFFTVHPDYNIGVVAPYYLPEDTVDALQQQLAAFGEDLNGDGAVHVTVNVYTLDYSGDTVERCVPWRAPPAWPPTSRGPSAPSSSSMTRRALRRTPAHCGIWTALCRQGTATATGGTWSTAGPTARSSPGWTWAAMAPTSTQNGTGDSQEYMSQFYVAFRGAWNQGAADSIAPGEPLWDKLTAGAVSTAAAEVKMRPAPAAPVEKAGCPCPGARPGAPPRPAELDNPYGRVYTPPPACPACAAGRKTQSKNTLCPQTADRAFLLSIFLFFEGCGGPKTAGGAIVSRPQVWYTDKADRTTGE